ncbi:MAG: hypothetical protein NTY17_01480 [Planctomycetia bacterium]|nr:hypothetical protein [Planctomycetia bacterium]
MNRPARCRAACVPLAALVSWVGLGFVAVAAEPPAAAPVNLLPNSSFEPGKGHPRLPDCWGLWAGGTTLAVKQWSLDYFGIDAGQESPVAGARVVVLRHPPADAFVATRDAASPLHCLLHTAIPGCPPGEHTISFYARSDRDGTALHLAHPAFAARKTFAIGTQWRRYSHRCKEAADLGFAVMEPGAEVWIAAPQLEAADPPTPYRPSRGEGGPAQNADLATPPLPELALPRVAAGPQLDGRLDDPCWSAAAKLECGTLVGGAAGARPRARTVALVASDGEAVCIGVRCDEPDMASLRGRDVRADDGAVFGGDAIEIFLAPRQAGGDYFQFGINAFGVTYESRGFSNVDWNGAWTAAVARKPQAWTAEIRIPFSSLPLAGAADTWRFNVCRDRSPQGGEWSSWAPVVTGFHDAARFGLLSGVDVAGLAAHRWLLAEPTLRKNADGSFTLAGRFPHRPADLAAVRLSVTAADAVLAEPVAKTCPLGEGGAVSCAGLRLEPDRPCYALVLGIADPATGGPLATLPVDVVPSDCDLLWGAGPLRAFMEFDVAAGAALLRGKLVWSGAGPAEAQARIETAAGRVVVPDAATVHFEGPGEQVFTVAAADLPDEPLTLVATAAGAAGEHRARDEFAKVAAGPVDVRLSRFTRGLVVGGKPFFPLFLPQSPNVLSDAQLGLLRDAGFNTLASPLGSWTIEEIPARGGPSPETAAAMRAQLDRLERLGFKFLWPLSWSCRDWDAQKRLCDGDVDRLARAFVGLVDAFEDHPAILAWYLLDEPSERSWEARFGYREDDMRRLHDAVKKADPRRPAFTNWNFGWRKEPYGGAACTDIMANDCYRTAGVSAFDLADLVDNARMLNDRRAGRKPGLIWISGSYGPPETVSAARPQDIRVHAWLHFVYGTRALGYWSGVPLDPESWETMRQFNR